MDRGRGKKEGPTLRVMVVGGGEGQVNAIRRARELGLEVVVSDRDPNAPGKVLADHFVQADTFDARATIEGARRYRVDGVCTLGTDQPVLTVARTAAELGLPGPHSVQQAEQATNKRLMKALFDRHGLPHSPYRLLDGRLDFSVLEGLHPPYVIKPVDSQGQRGVRFVRDRRELALHVEESLAFSRDGHVLVEEYYPGDELTFSGWVRQGRVYPLTITDRRTFSQFPHIGICYAHTFPSRHYHRYGGQILEISRRTVEALGLREGPLYFQMLVGEHGPRINEIACRIGGAYEDQFIPALTGVALNDLNFALALGLGGSGSEARRRRESGEGSSEGRDPESPPWVDEADASLRLFSYPASGSLAVLLFFARAGRVQQLGSREDLR
ncbi:MAG TPA: ATP-grasp domain-containing protein, partial [Sediminispirochaeta sp.]|nr:ATP-grasp domain-containing protein [Sediminispirochaeta sp.]